MYYKLAPGLKLRGYLLVPHAFYHAQSEHAAGLRDQEFELLLRCDGQTELERTPLLDSLIARQMAVACEQGEHNEPWQEYRFCNNRYFPAAKIAITGRCSFRCKHCFNAADGDSPVTAELTKDEIFDLLAQLDDCGVHRIEITGGEPLQHSSFMDIVREIARRKMNFSLLNTTAHFLTEEMLDEFCRLNLTPTFEISYDGIGYHDVFRGISGAEKKLLGNMEMIIAKGFDVYVNTNVNKQNKDTILPTILQNARLGAVANEVMRTYETPKPIANGIPFLSTEEYYDFALKTIEEYIQTDATMPLQFWHFASVVPDRNAYSIGAFACDPTDYRDSLPLCRTIRGKVQIDPSGNFIPCLFMSGAFSAAGISFGNIRNEKVRDILTDSRLLNTQCMTAGELQEHNAKCQNCEYWKACAGGCRCFGILYSETGYMTGEIDYLSHDPTKCLFFSSYLKPLTKMFERNGYACMNNLTYLPNH